MQENASTFIIVIHFKFDIYSPAVFWYYSHVAYDANHYPLIRASRNISKLFIIYVTSECKAIIIVDYKITKILNNFHFLCVRC